MKIPVKDLTKENAAARKTMRAPMILPHELLNYLSETWHEQIKCSIANNVHHLASADIGKL